jgi:hypothetical protein
MTILRSAEKNSKPPMGQTATPQPGHQHTIDKTHFFPDVPILPRKLSFFCLKLKICSSWATVNLFLPYAAPGLAWFDQKIPNSDGNPKSR